MPVQLANSEYRAAAETTAKTAARDLDELAEKGILRPEGAGRGARYVRSERSPDKRDFRSCLRIGTYSGQSSIGTSRPGTLISQ